MGWFEKIFLFSLLCVYYVFKNMLFNKTKFTFLKRYLVCIISLIIILHTDLLAHRDDYLDETIVYLTLAEQELELEYWFDYGINTGSNFIRNNFASEYGITSHWMIDGRITFVSPGIKQFNIESGRFETRYRFADEGVNPVDIALSAEINSEKLLSGEKESGFEGRIIFSKDVIEKLNLTLNLADELVFETGSTSFNTSFGFRYDANNFFRLGSELKYNTLEKGGQFVPQVWFTFGKDITLKLGYSLGLNKNPTNFGRLAFEAEL